MAPVADVGKAMDELVDELCSPVGSLAKTSPAT